VTVRTLHFHPPGLGSLIAGHNANYALTHGTDRLASN
jgi:hypothetical protein